jgi:hypothetical protein
MTKREKIKNFVETHKKEIAAYAILAVTGAVVAEIGYKVGVKHGCDMFKGFSPQLGEDIKRMITDDCKTAFTCISNNGGKPAIDCYNAAMAGASGMLGSSVDDINLTGMVVFCTNDMA